MGHALKILYGIPGVVVEGDDSGRRKFKRTGAKMLCRGRRVMRAPLLRVRPATEWTFVASIASSGLMAGRIVGRRFASMLLPAPGGPISSTLYIV